MKQDILILTSRTTPPEYIAGVLNQYGIPFKVVKDAAQIILELDHHTPAFLWLDLPTESARSLLLEITSRFFHPPSFIILASSFLGSADRAAMLDHGADACVECPVEPNEILSIINAVLRRDERMEHIHLGKLLPCIEYKDLFLDPLRREAKMRGQAVKLTRKEFDILHLLANHSGTALTREQIYSRVWKVQKDFTASIVADHISSIRQKLGLCANDIEYIQTVSRVGYRFADME